LNITKDIINKDMDIVRPVKIVSPISGQPVSPRIVERQYGDKIYVEAVWDDPASGSFIRKGVVRILDAFTKEDITNKCV
jgi:hypothetical protein